MQKNSRSCNHIETQPCYKVWNGAFSVIALLLAREGIQWQSNIILCNTTDGDKVIGIWQKNQSWNISLPTYKLERNTGKQGEEEQIPGIQLRKENTEYTNLSVCFYSWYLFPYFGGNKINSVFNFSYLLSYVLDHKRAIIHSILI